MHRQQKQKNKKKIIARNKKKSYTYNSCKIKNKFKEIKITKKRKW